MCAPSSHSQHRPDECPKPAPAQCTFVMSGIVPCTAQKLPRTRSHRCGMMHPDRHARASPIRAQMVRHAANLDKAFAVADKAGSKLTQQIFEAHKGDADITFKAAQRRYKAHCVEAEARSNAAAQVTAYPPYFHGKPQGRHTLRQLLVQRRGRLRRPPAARRRRCR